MNYFTRLSITISARMISTSSRFSKTIIKPWQRFPKPALGKVPQCGFGEGLDMKRIIFLILMIVSICGIAQAKESASKINIVTPDADIGAVEKARIFDYNIEVKNAGDGDLIIENAYSSCGCLAVTDKRWPGVASPGLMNQTPALGAAFTPPAKVVVKPNKSIYISVSMDTNKVSGEFEKMLHIISNDPENKDAMWKIKGNVGGAAIPTIPNAGLGRHPQTRIGDGAKTIMVFYSPGCDACREIMDNFLPEINKKYDKKITMVYYNIDNPESFAFLLDLQNKYDKNVKKGGFFNPKPPAVFVNNKLLYGVKEIKEKLEKSLK